MIKLNGKYQFFASLYLAVWMASTFFLLPHLLGIDLRDHQVHIMIKIAYALVMALCLPVGNYLVLKFGRYHEISGKP